MEWSLLSLKDQIINDIWKSAYKEALYGEMLFDVDVRFEDDTLDEPFQQHEQFIITRENLWNSIYDFLDKYQSLFEKALTKSNKKIMKVVRHLSKDQLEELASFNVTKRDIFEARRWMDDFLSDL